MLHSLPNGRYVGIIPNFSFVYVIFLARITSARNPLKKRGMMKGAESILVLPLPFENWIPIYSFSFPLNPARPVKQEPRRGMVEGSGTSIPKSCRSPGALGAKGRAYSKLVKKHLLVLNDLGLDPLMDSERRDLLVIIRG